ncbi:hypothetical protein TNCV_3823751 [Trichonephila clavipes]|nr:hypothetical protein TNCV_3823751 [Trichonephila clavipes]
MTRTTLKLVPSLHTSTPYQAPTELSVPVAPSHQKASSSVLECASPSGLYNRGVETSGSERYRLHEDQAEDTLDGPVTEKTAKSGPMCLLEPYEGAWLRDIRDPGANYVCSLDALPSTPPFGVVSRTRKLDCSGLEPSRL